MRSGQGDKCGSLCSHSIGQTHFYFGPNVTEPKHEAARHEAPAHTALAVYTLFSLVHAHVPRPKHVLKQRQSSTG